MSTISPIVRFTTFLLLLLLQEIDRTAAVLMFSASFQTSTEGFNFRRGNSNSIYEVGSFATGTGNNGYLQVRLGGNDDRTVTNMEGGWYRNIVLDQRSTVEIVLNYELIMTSDYEIDEFVEARCAINGILIGSRPEINYVRRVNGTKAGIKFNWVKLNSITLDAGTHSLMVGAYNNKKTWNNEWSRVRFSDVQLDYYPITAPVGVPTRTPTGIPTRIPTKSPTKAPVRVPTKFPTRAPTKRPTRAPTRNPTRAPVRVPTKTPIRVPTKTPTRSPTKRPSKVPTKLPTKLPTKMPTKAPTQISLDPDGYKMRINVGSSVNYVDPNGNTWIADSHFGNKGGMYSVCPYAIAGTDMDDLYCKERYFNQWQNPRPFIYDIPVPRPGAYTVRLHFSEIYHQTAGLRIFDVWVNGQLLVGSLDIFREVGHTSALVLPTVAQAKGTSVTVELVPKQDNPKICGIEVIEITNFVPPPTAAPVTAPFNLFINCGGSDYLESSGARRWMADKYFIGGGTYADTSNDIGGTVEDTLYHTERNGEFKYEIPVPTGSYEIILHFAELYWQSVRQRLFNIKVENEVVFTNVDIVALGGGVRLQAFTLEIPTIITDGFVSIELLASTPKIDAPKLSGIEINFLQPHLAHSVSNGPYIATDILNTGSAIVKVDGSFSHTHGTGLQVNNWIWKEGANVIGVGPSPNISLPVGVHTVTLTVKDSGNNEGADTTTITVNPFGFPAVLSIEPSSGTIAGGKLVTIKGSGFTYSAADTKVKFGLINLSGSAITIVNQYTITLRTPVAILGSPVAVSVETPLSISNDVTYTFEASTPIAFTSDTLAANIAEPTSVGFGPDGRLYVGTLYGTLHRLTLDDTFTRVVSSVSNRVAPFRGILGIAFNPLQTEGLSDVYITTSFFFHGDPTSSGGQSINGNVKMVSGANLDIIVDIVTGLPVSDHDHGLTGLEYGDNGEIYIQCASNTNAGIPGRLTGKQVQKDNYFSSATVVANLANPLFNGAITYNATDDGIPNGGNGIEVFAAGTRNPWGICLHSNGNIYASDNGPNVGYGDMMMGCNGEFRPDVTEGDKINLLKRGGYYGAPNRIRALTTGDTRQCTWHSQFEPSGNGYTAPILNTASSTDGLIEFQADHFDKQLRGNLIAAKYQGSLYRIVLSPDGNSVIPQSNPMIELTPDVDALDVIQAPDGTLISSSLDRNAIYFHKPIEQATTQLKVYSVFPRRGGQSGGNTLQLYGVNFNTNTANPIRIVVGGRACPIISFTPNKMECRMPGGSGTVDIVVTGSNGQMYNFERGYRYVTGLPALL